MSLLGRDYQASFSTRWQHFDVRYNPTFCLQSVSRHSLILTFDTGWYWHFPLPCANRCMTGWFSHQNMHTLGAGLVPDIYCRQGDSSLVLMKRGLNLSVDTLIRFLNCQLQWPCLHARSNASKPHTHKKVQKGHLFHVLSTMRASKMALSLCFINISVI